MFFMSRPLRAQNAQSGNYVIEQRYVRHLVWVGDEYTSKYEVVIERSEGKAYRAHMREFTKEPAIQVSLPPGNYRYRIISYDYLEQPGGTSEWVSLEIKPAPVVPVEVQTEADGSYIIRSPGDKPIIPGVNEIVIKNPAELGTDNGVLVVDEQTGGAPPKPFSFYISGAWSPLFFLYGRMQEIFGNDLYTSGASLRFGVLYNKLNWWFIPGLEFSSSWYALDNAQGSEGISIQTGVTGFNLVAHKRFFNQKMAATIRAGGALAYQTGETNIADETNIVGGLNPQINIGASYLYQVWKNFYAEAGLTFTMHLNQSGNSGYICPWLGIGWRF